MYNRKKYLSELSKHLILITGVTFLPLQENTKHPHTVNNILGANVYILGANSPEACVFLALEANIISL